jgi:hypothetical protein
VTTHQLCSSLRKSKGASLPVLVQLKRLVEPLYRLRELLLVKQQFSADCIS